MDATMRKIEVAASPHERSSAQTTSSSRLAYGIDGAADALDISRSRFYELIAAGEIAACKVGKRTIIPTTELAAFLDRHRVARLPDVRPGLAPRTAPAQSRQRGKSEPETE
jgi:excisionase family DNA binding protein